jgi:hypothetical protein
LDTWIAQPRRLGAGNRDLSCQVPMMIEALVVAHAAATLFMAGGSRTK